MIKRVINPIKNLQLVKYNINPLLLGLNPKYSHTHLKTTFPTNTNTNTNKLTNDELDRRIKNIIDSQLEKTKMNLLNTNKKYIDEEIGNKIKLIVQEELRKINLKENQSNEGGDENKPNVSEKNLPALKGLEQNLSTEQINNSTNSINSTNTIDDKTDLKPKNNGLGEDVFSMAVFMTILTFGITGWSFICVGLIKLLGAPLYLALMCMLVAILL